MRLPWRKKQKTETLATDGWESPVSGGRSAPSAVFRADFPPSVGEIDALMRQDGLASAIVNRIVEDAVRQGWELTFPDLNPDDAHALQVQVQEWSRKKDLVAIVSKHLKNSRAYGGSILAVGTESNLSAPLSETPDKIAFLASYDRHEVAASQTLVTDPDDRNFGLPNSYQLIDGNIFIHASRVHRAQNEKLSKRAAMIYDGWSPSVLEPCRKALSGYGSLKNTTDKLTENFLTTIVKFSGLTKVLAGAEKGLVQKRVNKLFEAKDEMNALPIDAGDSIEQLAAPLAGIPDLHDRAYVDLASCAQMPIVILFGTSPGGFGSGEGELNLWYDRVRSFTKDHLRQVLHYIYSVLFTTAEVKFDGPWEIKFGDLQAPSQLETAQLRQVTAQTDATYISMGVLDATEVATSRFGGTEYSIETQLDDEVREAANNSLEAPGMRPNQSFGPTADPNEDAEPTEEEDA